MQTRTITAVLYLTLAASLSLPVQAAYKVIEVAAGGSVGEQL